MTLATVFFLCIAYSALAPLLAHWPALAQQTSQNQTSQNQAGAPQQKGTAGAQAPASQAQTPSPAPTPAEEQKPATSKRARKKKKATAGAPVECPPTTSGSSAASADSTSAGTSPTSNSNQAASNQPSSNNAPSNRAAGKAAPSSNAPSGNCPPVKTVVHDGGTTEPAIQLVGGKNEQASQQRSTTDQLLGSTEDNLKKVAGRDLNPGQQEMVNQIQQFIEQSRAAVSAGDLARGHNLALKAHLLSDELVKP